ncbi:MAG: hypothetical protein JXR97_14505, partial [Planctomycetes bacterium]|nr:hypothetical protein [Planctomycetota bacterium]
MQNKPVSPDYELIDAGAHLRLERFGGVRVLRPAPMAGFSAKLSAEEISRADLVFSKNEKTGVWSGGEKLPEPWVFDAGPVTFCLAPS